MQVAEQFRDEPGMWFPHNMDFRGRAYPMPPHLNHLGSDTSRGILQFAEGRALGEHGLEWLYIQVAQLSLPTLAFHLYPEPGVAWSEPLFCKPPAASCKVQRAGPWGLTCTLHLASGVQAISARIFVWHCVTLGAELHCKKPSPLRGLTAWRALAQVANSWGQSVDKGSYAERTAFVRDHLDLVLDSAERPFDGHK